jgi:hypothetical protein
LIKEKVLLCSHLKEFIAKHQSLNIRTFTRGKHCGYVLVSFSLSCLVFL